MGTQYALRADVPVNEITLQVVKKDGSIENRTFDISNLKYITSNGSSSGGNNSNGSSSGGGSGGSKVIVSITSSNKSSRDDLAVSGTH